MSVKLVRLIKVRLIGKNLRVAFPIQNGVKQGHALLPLLFNFDLDYAISKTQENEKCLELGVTH
jgi:hypothetical protein